MENKKLKDQLQEVNQSMLDTTNSLREEINVKYKSLVHFIDSLDKDKSN